MAKMELAQEGQTRKERMSWVVKGKNGDETLYQQISIQRLPQKQKRRKPTQSEVLQGQEKVLQGQEDTSRVKKS